MAEEEERLFSVNEAAERYGVSSRTLRRWIASRRLPAQKFGPKLLRIRKADLDEMLKPHGNHEATE